MNIQEYNKHIKLHWSKWDFEKLNKHLKKLWFIATIIDQKDSFNKHIILDRIDGLKTDVVRHIYTIEELRLHEFKKNNIKEFIKFLIPN